MGHLKWVAEKKNVDPKSTWTQNFPKIPVLCRVWGNILSFNVQNYHIYTNLSYLLCFLYLMFKIKGGNKMLRSAGAILCCLATADDKKSLRCTRLMEVCEPPHGKTNNLHRRKQRRRSASRYPQS